MANFSFKPKLARLNHGSSLAVAMILILVTGIISAAMLRITGNESLQVSRLENEKQLRSAALGAIHYKKTGMYYITPVQFAAFLGNIDVINIGGTPVTIRVVDNDDGDSNPLIDRDGALRIVARAQRVLQPDYFEASVTVRMKTFTEYSVAWRNSVNLGQNFNSSGNMFVGGSIYERGYGCRHYDFVTCAGNYYSYLSNPNNTTWDRDDPTTAPIEPLTKNAIMPQWPDIANAQWVDLKVKATTQGRYVSSLNPINGSGSPRGVELYFDATTGYIWARPRGSSSSSWNKTWKPMVDGAIYYFDENIYIRGQYNARMTIVTGKDAYVLNDVVWEDQNNDSLGLMAKDDIVFSTYRPNTSMYSYVYAEGNPEYRPADYNFPYAAGNAARKKGYFGESGSLQLAMYAGDRLGAGYYPRYTSGRRTGTLMMSGSQTAVDSASNAFGNTFNNRIYGYNEKLKSLPPPDFMAINNVQPVFSVGSWEFDSN